MPERGRRVDRARDPRIQQIFESHCDLRRLLESVAGLDDLTTAAAQLEELRRTLTEHFQHEEAEEGLFALVVEQAPHLQSTVERCRDEHGALAAELAELCEGATHGGADQRRVLRDQFAAFVERVGEHEKQETQMFMGSLLDDVGEQD